jgi:hypothetical protein
MSDVDPSRVGLRSAGKGLVAGTDNDELFLKKFSGEILQTFEESNIFKPLHTIRTIENGKSAQFPVTGIATANYHTPGENIADNGNSYISDIAKTERVITIDQMLVASTFLANIDDVKNHYDIRSVYANELLQVLLSLLLELNLFLLSLQLLKSLTRMMFLPTVASAFFVHRNTTNS